MPLGWNEIRSRAVAFSKEWQDETREHAEAKTFWDDFFRVFGLNRRHLASFEEPVKKLSGSYGFIDLFWKGTLLAEHKSAGKSLSKAESQANDYVQSLLREGRGDEAPRYLIVSDFAQIALHDLESGEEVTFPLGKLHEYIDRFAFIPGYKQHSFDSEDPINLKAVQIMGDLHDALEGGGYTGHELERLLVRILFCLFAEDTGIFERSAFQLYLENHTKADGSDLGPTLSQFFHVLNTPADKRQANLPQELAALPYVNGDLFAEFLGFAAFDRAMRECLLTCTHFDWSRISPAVFGALFQSVMEPKERRQIGAHYTSERDILRVIGPLFLDELRQDLARAGSNTAALTRLHERIAAMRLLDPACGCGNFLVIAYRELRQLELEILKKLNRSSSGQMLLDISQVTKVDVDQMHGIEIEEWPARIAEVAMWLMDHQMNLRFSEEFGQYFVRLPLKKSPHVVIANALTFQWSNLLPAETCTHVLGNPPFIGSKFQTPEQRAELKAVTRGVKNAGVLDYVTGWYFKAAEYIRNNTVSVAFVSTNSITQGEQVSVLWDQLLQRMGLHIHFAHRTFEWQSEARGKAHVHVVIVGFGAVDHRRRYIFEYESLRSEPTPISVRSISPYLIEGGNQTIANRRAPLAEIPVMTSGNKPIDDGNYLFTPEERQEFLKHQPDAKPLFKRWLGGKEFLNGIERWCLFTAETPPEELREMPLVMERIENVRAFRKKSKSKPTIKLADTPRSFHTTFVSTANYLAMPQVSSERRTYIPIAFLDKTYLCGDKLRLVPDATLYHFGILTSLMHMAWVRVVSGRLKSDYQYSAYLVYNNFPWPSKPTQKQQDAVSSAAQGVRDARAEFPDATLADLYDPRSMPDSLTKAHQKLDRAVDRCYRSQPFTNERNRVEYLFKLYEQITAPIVAGTKRKRRRT